MPWVLLLLPYLYSPFWTIPCASVHFSGFAIFDAATSQGCRVFVQVPYSRFMHGLQQENVHINRKVLSELAMYEPFSFKALVDQVRVMRGPASGNA